MKKKLLTATIFSLALSACVTINIYFPAEEVKNAADKIVGEVWGAGVQKNEIKEEPRSFRFELVEPAYADQNVDVNTPQIAAIKSSMKARFAELRPLLQSGAIGLGQDGLLKVRPDGAPDLQSRSKASALADAENSDRKRLYSEIARANGFPDKAGEVQKIFAKSWEQQAEAGWFIEAGGSWRKK